MTNKLKLCNLFSSWVGGIGEGLIIVLEEVRGFLGVEWRGVGHTPFWWGNLCVLRKCVAQGDQANDENEETEKEYALHICPTCLLMGRIETASR